MTTRTSSPQGDDDNRRVTAAAFGGQAVVVSDGSFERLLVSQGSIRANFVGSRFLSCSFLKVRSVSGFWGANDTWHDCTFQESLLHGMISPHNRFRECRFTDVQLIGYRPHDTVFEQCHFCRVRIEGYVAVSGVAFESCLFTNAVFSGCSFGETRLLGCTFAECLIEHSELGNANGLPHELVLAHNATETRLSQFLLDLDAEVGQRLGPGHPLQERISAFREGHLAGTPIADNFAEYFIGYAHPADLRRIEKQLFRLYERYGF